MNRKQWILAANQFSYVLVMILLYVLQTTPGFLAVYGVKPNFVVAAAVCIAMYEGEFAGGIYGLLAGILCDLSSMGLFGFHSVILLIAGVCTGLLVIYMLRPGIINYILLLFGTLMTQGLLDYLLNYLMWGYENVWMVLVYKILPTILYSAAVSPLIYYLLVWMRRKFQEQIPT